MRIFITLHVYYREFGLIRATADHETELQIERPLDHMYIALRSLFFYALVIVCLSNKRH